ncbi:MAG: NAD(P)-dependent oxidoreductase [Alphaproteobacteria bacterium]|nr:NAD(P)-dependent oxidoreductase [Alphaproteobacteria bacterium]
MSGAPDAVAAPVGFIGVGIMGRPMAACLRRAGFAVLVHDARAETAEAVAREIRATALASPAAIGAASPIVVTMLPSSAEVRAVTLGAGGLVEGFRPRSIVLDMSSSVPAETVTLAADLARLGHALVDAPVSGGRPRAIDGTLTLMVGGTDADVAHVMPVLRAMGKDIFRTGPAGSGHAMKALNNLLNGLGVLAAAETLAIGRRFGLDPKVMVDVVNASTGMNHATRNKMERYVFSRAFNSGFGLDLMVKDLEIALGIAAGHGAPAPLGERCLALWQSAQTALGAGRDHTEIARWVEERAATHLGGDG